MESILRARHKAETELHDAKRALEAKSEDLARLVIAMRATLESTSDAFLVTDGTGHITHFNANYVKMWNIAPDVVSNTNHHQVLRLIKTHFPDPEAFIARIGEIYDQEPLETF